MTREEAIKSMSLQDAIQVFKDTNCYGTMDIAKSVILKALEQEPRKGHWKLVQRGKAIDICCSNCKAVRIEEWAYNYTIDEYIDTFTKEDINKCFGSAEMRFCPNCGAKMESEDKE